MEELPWLFGVRAQIHHVHQTPEQSRLVMSGDKKIGISRRYAAI
jgi:hypothetical protein